MCTAHGTHRELLNWFGVSPIPERFSSTTTLSHHPQKLRRRTLHRHPSPSTSSATIHPPLPLFSLFFFSAFLPRRSCTQTFFYHFPLLFPSPTPYFTFRSVVPFIYFLLLEPATKARLIGFITASGCFLRQRRRLRACTAVCQPEQQRMGVGKKNGSNKVGGKSILYLWFFSHRPFAIHVFMNPSALIARLSNHCVDKFLLKIYTRSYVL